MVDAAGPRYLPIGMLESRYLDCPSPLARGTMMVAVVARMAAKVFTAATFGARLCLAVAAAYLVALAPHRAQASENRW